MARWASPGCRTTPSVPAHANYRETNASRLRQEIKGMTVSGFIRKGRRSSSSSPSKKRSGNSSPIRSLSEDSGSPTRNESDRNLDLGTSRTTSELSCLNRDTQDKHKVEEGQPGYACDNRTKYLNKSVHPSTATITISMQREKRDIPSVLQIGSPTKSKLNSATPGPCKGYGKPLITPINKKLLIRRDYPLQDDTPAARESSHVKIKPSSRPSSPRSYLKSGSSKLPVKTNQVVHRAPFNTSPKLSDTHFNPQLTTKETPTNGIPGTSKRKSLDIRGRSNVKLPSPKPAMNRYEERTESKPRDLKIAGMRHKTKPSLNLPEQTMKDASRQDPKMTSRRLSVTRIPLKIQSENSIKHRKCSTDKLRQQFCRDTPVYAAGRPNSAMHNSTRTFKPQLEDIKSSYLLLNNREAEHDKNLKAKTKEIVNKSVEETANAQPLSLFEENKRKELLIKIKQKFKSKTFFQDSRYDKIEGLNWISWNN